MPYGEFTQCPNCGKTIPQSYCRKCRSSHKKLIDQTKLANVDKRNLTYGSQVSEIVSRITITILISKGLRQCKSSKS